MVYYIAAAVFLCALLWKWRNRVTVIFGCVVAFCAILFIGSVIDGRLERSALAKIPCAVLNTAPGRRALPAQGSDTGAGTDAREADCDAALGNLLKEGMLGEHSFYALKQLKGELNILEEKQKEYYVDKELYSSSLLADSAKQCRNDDVYIVIKNTTDELIVYEKMRLTAHKRGHSTELLDVVERDFREDVVLQPNELTVICHSFPNLKRQHRDLTGLTFDITLQGITTKKFKKNSD